MAAPTTTTIPGVVDEPPPFTKVRPVSAEPSLWAKLQHNSSEAWYKIEEAVDILQVTAGTMWDAMKFRSDAYDTSSSASSSSNAFTVSEESAAERRRKIKALNLSWYDFVDPNKPWQLVESGSLLGYFDWVPVKLRKGPWVPIAPAVLSCMVYLVAVGNVYAYNNQQEGDGWWLSASSSSSFNNDSPNFWQRLKRPNPSESAYRFGLPEVSSYSESEFDVSQYPQFNEALWHYNALASVWMGVVSYGVLKGPGGINAWATYSMWSWQILHNRHILVTLAPFLGYNKFVVAALELSRLPALIMTSMTFVMWNFVLM